MEMAAALLTAAVGVAVPQLYLDSTSSWEVVFNDTRDLCPDLGPPAPADDYARDGTDSMPAAYYSRTSNLTYMWAAVSGGIRPNIGIGPRGLDMMSHDCKRVLFNSSFKPTPESFANFQWLQSAHLFDNGTGFALVHNEFHGWSVPNAAHYCSYNHTVHPPHGASLGGVCNMWSTGVAHTTDGGESWQLVSEPPAHRVFSTPYKYEKDDVTFGYGALSSVLPGDDGAYYGLVHVLANRRHPRGQSTANCAFRSASPLDPSTYRLWGGRTFDVDTSDPYKAPTSATADDGLCAGVTNFTGESDFVSHPSPRRLVGTGFGDDGPHYILFGDKSVSAPGIVSYRFSNEHDFAKAVTRWSDPPQLLDLGLTPWMSAQGKVLYPTLLDSNSPTLGCNSFTRVGNESAYIYINLQRSLLRRRVHFRMAPPSPLPTPSPTPPPLPTNCTRICVGGSGRSDANGQYAIMTSRFSDTRPIFQKDDTHQLYRYQGYWKIAHFAVPNSVLFTQSLQCPNSTMPPSSDWRSTSLWDAPAPAVVRCCEAQSAVAQQTIFDQLDTDLLPLQHDAVLLGCVGPSCGDNPVGEPTRHTNEAVLQRKFDLHTSFIQPSYSIFTDVGGQREDTERLHHFSWQLCRSPFDDGLNCTWRAIANGAWDDRLIIPAARHIVANVTRPIVLALCNEMMSKDYIKACGAFPRFSPECSAAYKAMYAHVRRVFAREGVRKRHVVWSWNTFNVPAIDKHGRPGNHTWDDWFVGASNVTWVGINAFNDPTVDPNGTSFVSVRQLYDTFYRWVADKPTIRPFFHAFGTAEKLGHPGWKKAWFEQLPSLLGPGGAYPRIRVATLFPGDVYDIQTSGESIAGAKIAANAPVFNATGRANATAAACCAGTPNNSSPRKCCWEYK